MNLEQVSKLSKDIDSKVLQLIYIKIENDMEKVLAEFKNQNMEFKAINSEIKRLEDKQDTKFAMMMWAMGLLMATMIALKIFS